MDFSKDYFDEEVIDGFFVEPLMKRCWAAQAELLETIDKICRENDLRWWAHYGTLLGTIRHGGFIPWDDDLDICMPREDYVRLEQVLKSYSDDLYIMSMTDHNEKKDYLNFCSRIAWNRKHIIDRDYFKTYHDFLFPCGVDIFLLDYLSDDDEYESFRRDLMPSIKQIVACVQADNRYPAALEETLQNLEYIFETHLDRSKPLRRQIYALTEQMFSQLPEGTRSKYLTVMHEYYAVKPAEGKYALEALNDWFYLPFLNGAVRVASAYDEMLRSVYGRYDQFYRHGAAHNYPYYETYNRVFEKNPYRYSFKREDLQANRKIIKSKAKKKEILIIPYRAKYWYAIQSVYEEACEEPNTEVYVMPVNLLYRNAEGIVAETLYEGTQYPQNVKITDFHAYNLAEHHPDEIYIQNAYDYLNPVIAQDENFSSRVLMNYTDKLIYIPWSLMSEVDEDDGLGKKDLELAYFLPGVMHADEVRVQSKTMRRNIINQLTMLCGEDTRLIWEDKIIAGKFPIYDYIDSFRKPEKEKKRALYYASVASVCCLKQLYIKEMEEKIQRLQHSGYDIFLSCEKRMQRVLSALEPQLLKEFEDTIERLQKTGKIELLKDPESPAEIADILANFDHYEGDDSELSWRFKVIKHEWR